MGKEEGCTDCISLGVNNQILFEGNDDIREKEEREKGKKGQSGISRLGVINGVIRPKIFL